MFCNCRATIRQKHHSRTAWGWFVASGCLLLCFSPAARCSDTELVDAAENENWQTVEALARRTSDVDQTQPDGMTALHWAVYYDNPSVTELLIKRSANVDAATRYGVRPLSIACRNGNAAIVTTLLEANANPNAKLLSGETPLLIAARTGNVDVVRLLIEADADINGKERNRQTALMWAAAEGHLEVVDYLLEQGADFRTPLSSGYTPLFLAVREGKLPVVERLLDAGLDVNDVMQSQRNGGRWVRKGTSPLLLAVENGHFELAVRLLERGADPNDMRSGFTSLHVLTWVRKPNRGDGQDGHPSPIGSGSLTSEDMIRELVAHGADVNARLEKHPGGGLNKKGATPFFMACATADLPMMLQLVELGADLQLTNAISTTPLLAAAGVGTRAPFEEAGTEEEVIEALEWLIQQGADVNAVDRNGETAMHGAAYKNLPDVARMLATKGADIEIWNRPNKNDWTPLLIAEGFRPGNFKPSHDTIEAIYEIMREVGVEPPPPTDPRDRRKRDGYE